MFPRFLRIAMTAAVLVALPTLALAAASSATDECCCPLCCHGK